MTDNVNPSDAVETADLAPKKRSGRILAVANQKGGVGKTTTAINLSTALAAVGRRVILFDLDPQGNASTGVGIDRNAAEIGSYEVLIDGASIKDAVIETEVPNLSLVAASIDLSGAELELVEIERREFRLRQAFEEFSDDYDYVLIDCPPALGLLTLNALVLLMVFWCRCNANIWHWRGSANWSEQWSGLGRPLTRVLEFRVLF